MADALAAAITASASASSHAAVCTSPAAWRYHPHGRGNHSKIFDRMVGAFPAVAPRRRCATDVTYVTTHMTRELALLCHVAACCRICHACNDQILRALTQNHTKNIHVFVTEAHPNNKSKRMHDRTRFASQHDYTNVLARSRRQSEQSFTWQEIELLYFGLHFD